MKLKKIAALAMAMVLTCGAFAACGDTSGNSGVSNTASTASTASTSGTGDAEATAVFTPKTVDDAQNINANAGMEPTGLNTMTASYSIEFSMFKHLYENLLMLDENDVPQPAAAESYELSDDSTVYTFKLREDGVWTNGDPVTAHDFEFAWKTVLDPATAADYAQFLFIIKNGQGYYDWLTYQMDTAAWEKANAGKDAPTEVKWEDVGVKVLDDYTLEVTLERPTAYAASQFTFGTFAPVNQRFYEAVGADQYSTEAQYFCTNGPYALTEWTHDSQIVMQKNDAFHGASDIGVEQITWKIITDPQTAVTDFLSGNLDMVNLSTGELIDQVKQQGYEPYSYSDGSAFYVYFNCENEYLSNVNLRQALALGFDKQAMIDTVWKTGSMAMTSFTAPAVVGFDGKPFVDSLQAKFGGELTPANGDVEKAKEYLATALSELGCTVEDLSAALSVDCGDASTSQAEAAFYQEQWRTNLGITVTINPMQTKQGSANRKSGDYCMSLTGWGPDYNDPMTFLDLWVSTSGNNDTGYADADYDALIDAATNETDLEARQEIFYELEQKFIQDVPVAPSWWRAPSYAVSAKIAEGTVLRTAFQDINFTHVKLA